MIQPTATAILEQLSEKGARVLNLLALCRTPEYQHVWGEGPESLRRFARLLLKQGHPTLALEVAARGRHRVTRRRPALGQVTKYRSTPLQLI